MPARWTCRSCGLDFCSHCVGSTVIHDPECLCCSLRMHELPLEEHTVPFYELLPQFFALPTERATLALMAVAAVLWSCAPVAPPLSLVMPLIGSALLGVQASRLCFRIAHGWFKPPPKPLLGQPGFANVLRQGLVLLALLGEAWCALNFLHSVTLMYVVLAVGLLLVPAALMTVIVTDDLVRALNPIHLIILAVNMGWAYLPLWLLPLLMFAAGRWLFMATEPVLPPMLAFGLYGALYSYLSFVTSSWLGYVAFQRHRLLGQRVRDASLEIAGVRSTALLAPPPDRAQLLLMKGARDEARDALYAELLRQPENIALHERYHELLKETGNIRVIAPHTDLLIGKLIDAGRVVKALQVYSAYVKTFGALDIKEGGDVVRLADQALLRRQPRVALNLLNRFAQRYPEHPETPRAWLLSARALNECTGDVEKARLMLVALQKRFPRSSEAALGQQLMESLRPEPLRNADQPLITSKPTTKA